jgi:hypothetical protein
MAEDGVLVHDRSTLQMVRDESRTVEDSFNRFIAWCAAQTACALHGQDVGALFDDLTARADQTAIPAPAVNGTATGTAIRYAVQGLLIVPQSGWPMLADAIVAARNGDTGVLAEIAAGSVLPGQLAIECMDYPTTATSLADVAAAAATARRIAPHLRSADQSGRY